jgi:predicted nuclease with TOPRIM domain
METNNIESIKNDLTELVYTLGELSYQKMSLTKELERLNTEYDNVFSTINKLIEENIDE